MANSFSFTASVAQAKTMADNGLRVSFDLPETATKQFSMLIECKRLGIPLNIEVSVANDILVKEEYDFNRI